MPTQTRAADAALVFFLVSLKGREAVNKRVFDLFSLLGLVVSAAAVCDELLRWDNAILNAVYLCWGVAAAASVAVILLFSKPRAAFQAVCREGAKLLGLRTIVALLLFLLGWYVNAASEQLYGAGSDMVEGNGVRLFAVIFTLVAHVVYFAFTKRKQEL